MGSRADFYVGRGESAEWLGSTAWDGYPEGVKSHDGVLTAKTEDAYRASVERMLAEREDATRPADGWPWPWENSRTTDFAYAFDCGAVYASCFGGPWFDPKKVEDPDDRPTGSKVDFPDMTERKRVTMGKRSGVIFVGTKE